MVDQCGEDTRWRAAWSVAIVVLSSAAQHAHLVDGRVGAIGARGVGLVCRKLGDKGIPTVTDDSGTGTNRGL